ncbi:MAG: copper homeostasis protein CutC [Propioniciclava sp.]
MHPLLEVIALNETDARNAEAGGADRLELVGSMDSDGLSPSDRTVERVRSATSLPVRVMVRLRAGFGTDAAELDRLRRVARRSVAAGADGLVLGFLDSDGDVDQRVMEALTDGCPVPWTFHRAVDHSSSPDRVWSVLRCLPGLDQVLSAGSPRGAGHGLASLIRRAGSDAFAAARLMVGGGLAPVHVPPLLRAGVRAFHLGSLVRPGGSYAAPVFTPYVAQWRDLLNTDAA